MVSLSRIISLRSIETTSPVSSSTNLHAMYLIHEQLIFYRYIFKSCFRNFNPQQGQKFQGYPCLFQIIARNNVVTGNFSFCRYKRTLHY
jgi:hypothetical protein